MTHIAIYLFACFMVVASVSTGKYGTYQKQIFPTTIDKQCVDRHFSGACIKQNNVNGEVGCLSLFCARPFGSETDPTKKNAIFEAIGTGHVNDGTVCATGKICDKGICVAGKSSSKTILGASSPRFYCFTPIPARIEIPRAQTNRSPLVNIQNKRKL